MMSLMSSGGVTTADLACSVPAVESEPESDDDCDSMNFLAAAAMVAICWLESVGEEDAVAATAATLEVLSLPFSSYLQCSKMCLPSSRPATA